MCFDLFHFHVNILMQMSTVLFFDNVHQVNFCHHYFSEKRLGFWVILHPVNSVVISVLWMTAVTG